MSAVWEGLFCLRFFAALNAFFDSDLTLNRPIYEKTSCYGHFGRDQFPWEAPKELNLKSVKHVLAANGGNGVVHADLPIGGIGGGALNGATLVNVNGNGNCNYH